MYNIDVAMFQVKIAEGALYPTVSAVGNVRKQYGSTASLAVVEQLSASLGAQVSVARIQTIHGIHASVCRNYGCFRSYGPRSRRCVRSAFGAWEKYVA
jgi:hypothetical protein